MGRYLNVFQYLRHPTKGSFIQGPLHTSARRRGVFIRRGF